MTANQFWKAAPILLGAITLFIFGTGPLITDLVAPAPDPGKAEKVIETTKGIIDALSGEQAKPEQLSRHEQLSNLFTILGFVFFTLTTALFVLPAVNFEWDKNAVIGMVLAITGLAIFLAYLGIGLIPFLIFVGAVLLLLFLFLNGFFVA